MNKLLPKQQRNEIYRKAKQLYIENGIYKTGMCYACVKVLHEYEIHITKENFNDLYKYLPEMWLVKPNNKRNYFWWEVNQIKKRLDAFDQMIKYTE